MHDTVEMILNSMSGVKRAQVEFLLELFRVLMSFQGRANFRNLSRYSCYCEKSFSRWHRKLFNFQDFNKKLIKKELGVSSESIAVIDASFISKSGSKTEGLGKYWNGKSARAEKGLEVSAISIVDIDSMTGYTVDCCQTFDKADGVSKTRIEQYCDQIVQSKDSLKGLKVKYIVTDGNYSKNNFTTKVVESGFEQIGKLRRDADILWKYDGEYSGRGRPRKYIGRVDFTSRDLGKDWETCTPLEDGTLVYSATVHSRSLDRLIKVVLLRSVEDKFLALLFSTDLEQKAMKIVEYYRARFQIEFIFRDAKQYTGLEDFQVRVKEAIHTHINASLTALNLIKFEDRKAKGVASKTVISIDSWKRRKSNQFLLKRLFSMLEINLTCKKVKIAYDKLSDFNTIAA